MILEGLLMVYFAFGMYSAFIVGDQGGIWSFPFHLMLFLGFGFVFFNSLKPEFNCVIMLLRSLNYRQLASTAIIGLSLITYMFCYLQKDMSMLILVYVF